MKKTDLHGNYSFDIFHSIFFIGSIQHGNRASNKMVKLGFYKRGLHGYTLTYKEREPSLQGRSSFRISVL